MRAVPLVFGGRGAEHPRGKEGERTNAREGRPRGPRSRAFVLSGRGVLERGRADTSSVTWARIGELRRDKSYPGRASFVATCTGLDRLRRTDAHNHSYTSTLSSWNSLCLARCLPPPPNVGSGRTRKRWRMCSAMVWNKVNWEKTELVGSRLR